MSNPRAYLWIGIVIKHDSALTAVELNSRCATFAPEKRVFEYNDVTVDGAPLQFFWCADEVSGFGSRLLSSTWDENTGNEDPVEFQTKLYEMTLKVRRAFKSLGITEEPKVNLMADLV